MHFLNLALATAVSAQFTCSNAAQTATFDVCVRNAMTDPVNNQYGFTNPQTACASALTFQTQRDYYKCICDRATSALDCYTFCPGDPIVATNRQLANQYCEAYRNYPVDGSVPAPSPVSLPPLPRVPITSTTTTQPIASPTKPAISSANTFDRLGMLFTVGFVIACAKILFE